MYAAGNQETPYGKKSTQQRWVRWLIHKAMYRDCAWESWMDTRHGRKWFVESAATACTIGRLSSYLQLQRTYSNPLILGTPTDSGGS